MAAQPLEQCSREDLTVLQAAAVCGLSFDAQLVADVLRTESATGDRRPLLPVFERGIGLGILTAASERADRYAFVDAGMRDTVLDTVDIASRAVWHAAVVRALLSRHPDPDLEQWNAIAHHCWLAGEAVPAAMAWNAALRAGEGFAHAGQWEAAEQHLANACATVDRLADALAADELARRRQRAWHALATARHQRGDRDGARAAYEAAADAARSMARAGAADGAARLAEAALGVGAARVWVEAGNVDEPLVALLEEARAALGDDRPDLRARLLGRLAEERYFASRPEKSRQYRDEVSRAAVGLARQVGDPYVLAAALNSRRYAYWTPDNHAERFVLSAELIELVDDLQDPELESPALMWWINDLLEQGGRTAIDVAIERVERLAARQRRPFFEWQAGTLRTMQALLDGELDRAEAVLDRTMAIGMDACPIDAHVIGLVQRFALRREQDRLAELADPIALVAATLPTLPVVRAALCHLQARVGRLDEARVLFEAFAVEDFADHVIPYDQNWPLALALLSEVAIRLDDRPRAARLCDLLRPLTDLNVIVAPGVAVLGPMGEVRAGLASCVGRREEAAALLIAAEASAYRLRAQPQVQRIGIELARLRSAGGPGDAGQAPGVSALPPSRRNALRWVGAICEITWQGTTRSVSGRLMGMRYLAAIIAAGEEGTTIESAYQRCTGRTVVSEPAIEQYDAPDIAMAERALRPLRAEIAEREDTGLPIADAMRERAEELADLVLNRRRRFVGGTTQRLRKSLLEAVRKTCLELRAHELGDLADHIERALDTRDFSTLYYRPASPMEWDITLPAPGPRRRHRPAGTR